MSLIGAALLLGAAAFMLRGLDAKGAPVFAVLAGVVILGEAAEPLGGIFSSVSDICADAGIDTLLSTALKLMGLGYLFGITADSVREIGEPFIAKCVETVGSIEMIAVILPFLEELLSLAVELLR